MLAEPRRKQKWSLNPRGKEWSEDSNKFGQKMLEKMGWTNGKGLGVNEQGITEHVRVSFKNDTAGIGFKQDSINEAWTEHQDNFNDFLQKLQQNEINSTQTEENKNVLSGKSLELKSKQSRTRVHYQKFTRGKDVNKYSAKDLANIFGQKELNINNNNSKDDNSSVGIQENRNGVITINGGNMTEYFMKKGQDFSLMQNKHKKHQKNKEESEYPGFGFSSELKKVQSHESDESKEIQTDCNYVFDNPCIQLNSENISNVNNEIEFSKKRKSNNIELHLSDKVKKFKEDNINEKVCANGIVNAGLNLEYQDNEICNGKEFEVSRVQFGVTNSALDLSDEVNKKRVTFNDHVEYSTDCIKKKKNRTTLDKFEVENKKVKKKKKHDVIADNSILSGFVNEALDIAETIEEVHDNEVNERKSKKSKKRNHQSNLETIVEISEEEKACEDEIKIKHVKMKDNTLDNSIVQDASNKKKKKKKDKDKEKIEIHVENKYDEKIEKKIISEINTLEKDCEIHEDQKNIIKKKKKKKDKDKSIEPNIKKEENTKPTIKSEAKTLKNIEEKNIKLETIQVKNKRVKEDDGINDLNLKVTKKDQKKNVNKENTENIENTNENETNKSEKKKHKKLINECVDNKNFNDIEFEKKTVEQRNIIVRNTQSKTFNNRTFNTSSPWNEKAKMSKRLLISLFNKNSTVNFPGSNMHDIKGYGIDIH